MSDRLAAYLRTYWPLLLGHLAAVLTAWLAARAGIRVDQAWVYEALALGLSAAVYAAGRWLEDRDGDGTLAVAARLAGRWILALGLDTGKPVYGLPPARSEITAQHYPDGGIREIRSVSTYLPRDERLLRDIRAAQHRERGRS
ncbi:hypothetical protein AB0N38_33045 [Micromonospora aurantiaca]|uniref:hypothetical protein n=1 Tax=Micromonospora aurantiaca (nom. illeg.) TaxID=47850 RepID=UPI00342E578E